MKLFNKSIRCKTALKIFILTVSLFFLFRGLLSPPKRSYHLKKNGELDKVCKAHTKYTITRLEDLWDNVDDLHCIFHLGLEPQRVPQGPFYGEIISLFETYFFNRLVQTSWKGKFITKVNCKENKFVHLGWNYIAGPFAPFVASIEPLANKIRTSSIYSDNKTALFFDLRPDFKEHCTEMNETDAQKYPIKNFSPWGRKFWPLTQMVDILRPVGKQEDGGIIYLGQLYIVDVFSSDKKATPCCFFALINYDADAAPFLKSGDSLQPFQKAVHYRREGTIRSLMRFSPLYALHEPLHTFSAVLKESWLFLKNAPPFLKDYFKAQFSGTKEELARHLKLPENLNIPSGKFYRNSNYISVQETTHTHQLEL